MHLDNKTHRINFVIFALGLCVATSQINAGDEPDFSAMSQREITVRKELAEAKKQIVLLKADLFHERLSPEYSLCTALCIAAGAVTQYGLEALRIALMSHPLIEALSLDNPEEE